MFNRFLKLLRFCWGRVRFFFCSLVDLFQLTFATRRAVEVELKNEFAAMREVTRAIRNVHNRPHSTTSERITVVDNAGGFTLSQSDLNSLAVMLYARDGFPKLRNAPDNGKTN